MAMEGRAHLRTCGKMPAADVYGGVCTLSQASYCNQGKGTIAESYEASYQLPPIIAIGTMVMGPNEQVTGQTVEMLASRQSRSEETGAHERVLGNASASGATLFARQDYIEGAWRIVDPVLKQGSPLDYYEPNTETDGTQPATGTVRWHAEPKGRRERGVHLGSARVKQGIAWCAA
jgi:Glucose-6-phosphate dehydrogenase, C-terminal domain